MEIIREGIKQIIANQIQSSNERDLAIRGCYSPIVTSKKAGVENTMAILHDTENEISVPDFR